MRLSYSESEEALAADLRAFLARTLPELPPRPDPNDWAARRAYDTGWQRRLYDAGYAGISWPKAYGGREASPTEQLVFLEEMNRAGAPYIGVNFVGNLHA
ncbi:MAG TPA: acyl-CoA dehydrogenase family protein, partial [Acidimicrobiales bacterium]